MTKFRVTRLAAVAVFGAAVATLTLTPESRVHAAFWPDTFVQEGAKCTPIPCSEHKPPPSPPLSGQGLDGPPPPYVLCVSEEGSGTINVCVTSTGGVPTPSDELCVTPINPPVMQGCPSKLWVKDWEYVRNAEGQVITLSWTWINTGGACPVDESAACNT